MIENEFKIMLTKAQYEKLRRSREFSAVEQVNYYYDTGDLEMSARHVTVRVRELGGKFYLQMKLPTEKALSRVELEAELEELPETLPGDLLNSLANGEKGEFPEVKKLGSLKTTRSVWEFDGGEIDLDKSEYFGKTDYEVEIEFTNEQNARRVLNEITELLEIRPNSEVCAGKVRRFLEMYKNRLN